MASLFTRRNRARGDAAVFGITGGTGSAGSSPSVTAPPRGHAHRRGMTALLVVLLGVTLALVSGARGQNPANAVEATAAAPRWVDDIRVVAASDDEDAVCPGGYERKPGDLNDKAGGSYVYLCLRYTSDASAMKVTNVWTVVYEPSSSPKTGEHPPLERSEGFQYCNSTNGGVIIEPTNLNSGVLLATQQYLCFTTTVNADPDIAVASGGLVTLIHDITSISFDETPASVYNECTNAAGAGAFPLSAGERQRGGVNLNAALFRTDIGVVYGCIIGDVRSGEPGRPLVSGISFANGASNDASCTTGRKGSVDLNNGVEGNFIYPCVNYTNDAAASHVIDIWAIYRDSPATGDADCEGNSAGPGRLDGTDLNDGAGGDYIHICTTNAVEPSSVAWPPQLRSRVVGDLQFGIVSRDDTAEEVCGRLLGPSAFPIRDGATGLPADFNHGIHELLGTVTEIAGCVLPAPALLHSAVNLFYPDGTRYFGGAWTKHALSAVTECTHGTPPYGATPANPGALTASGMTAAGACRDATGQFSNATSGVALIDTSPPVISVTLPPRVGTWYRTAVTVGFSCVDEAGGSGLATNSVVDIPVSGEGAHTVTSGSCSDAAGNAAGPAVELVKIDSVQPAIAFDSASPPANEFGWRNVDIVVRWTCTDSTSGVGLGGTVSHTVTGEGSNLAAEGTCADLAGNTATATLLGHKIDRTKPRVVSSSFSRAPDHAGWYTGNVSFQVVCADDLSQLVSNPSPVTVAAEGTAVVAETSCAERAGNLLEVSSPAVQLDKSAPLMDLSFRTPATSYGWNNSDVDVVWSCTDDVSGTATYQVARLLTAEGPGQVATATCVNGAGLTTTKSEAVSIDTGQPLLTLTPSRPPDSGAWYSSPFVLRYVCTEVGDSGLAGPGPFDVSQEFAEETAGVTLENGCSDKAGNVAITSFSWKLDSTPPVATIASVLPAPSTFGWNRGDVTVTAHCTDTLSGPRAPSVSAVATSEGIHPLSLTCEDAAGHRSAAAQEVRIDRTSPTMTIAKPANGERVPLGTRLVPDLLCQDSLSGVAECRNDSNNADALDTSVAGPRVFSAIVVDKAGNATRLTINYTVADPTRIDVSPILELRVLLGVAADLRNQTTGKPIADALVTFRNGAGSVVCTTTTDSRGTARCRGIAALTAFTLGGGKVTADYAGADYLMPSQHTDNLIA
jgi:hypothetical protein